ncbi:MAG: glycogen debranching enzyme family protein, partial [Planctomycetes bacterium]|nr:glycogen debranching enzyme family protein [Planctomycetota bacterium]
MTSPPPETSLLAPPIQIAIGDDPEPLLTKEWLLTYRIGAYASSTVIACNTRRYHGLLIATASPPMGRFLALASVMEQVTVKGDERLYELATNEFDNTFSPMGMLNLVEFRNDVAPTFVYRFGGVELTKEIALAEAANAVAVRYTVRGGDILLRLRPFVALRDFHELRQSGDAAQVIFEQSEGSVAVRDLNWPRHSVHLCGGGAAFAADGQWWRKLRYRRDIARGQDGVEDLYSPGSFLQELSDVQACQFTASIDQVEIFDFDETVARKRARVERLAASVGDNAPQSMRQLAAACDAFVVRRDFTERARKPSATILAGYPWFADWGRDAFIALPGLLLATARLSRAEQVFKTFCANMSDGMIPNCFDDRTSTPLYN